MLKVKHTIKTGYWVWVSHRLRRGLQECTWNTITREARIVQCTKSSKHHFIHAYCMPWLSHRSKGFKNNTTVTLLERQETIADVWVLWVLRMSTMMTGNSPVTGEFPAPRPVTRGFDVFFDLRLNKRLSKQWWGCWFETPSHALWRHGNDHWTNKQSGITYEATLKTKFLSPCP